jgi:hypothetical protein
MALHSHDDLLSVYFSHAGEIILGDAGRYSYAPGPQRDYFLSQRAHNTIVVSASLTEPPRLLGTRLARSVEDRSTAGARRWFASLMTAGSECRRTVLVTDRANVVSVVDSIFPRSEGAAPEELAWVWNVGHDVTETKASRSEGRGLGEWTLATRRGQHVRLAVVVTESGAPTSCDVDLIRGQQNPLMGWCSPRWGMMCPTTAIVIRAGRDRLLVVRTDIEVIKGRASSGE